MYSITVENLTKKFGDFTAVNNVSFRIPAGEIFGFLGSNGAGKSTLIRMLCGIMEPTSGGGTVSGYDIVSEAERVKESIGYMSQRFSLYNDLTVEENITFFGGAYDLKGKELESRKTWALETSRLQGREKQLTKSLSVGWKQRLALVCAILHRPKIVFLDEPTGGVDPISRRQFWDTIRSLAHEGITVFVTTHFLDEAEHCTSIGLIHEGRLVAQGTVEELKSKYVTNPIYELTCDKPVDALELLQKTDFIIETSIFGTSLHVITEKRADIPDKIIGFLKNSGIENITLEPIEPSLEDVFIHLIEQQFTLTPDPSPKSGRGGLITE